jgi:hypothetical protein
MHGPINVKSPNNTSTWQMGFNSAFKGLRNFPHFMDTESLLLRSQARYTCLCPEANQSLRRLTTVFLEDTL